MARDKEKKKQWQRRKYAERKIIILNIKKNSGCNICGYNTHPEILEFHHKDKTTKKFGLSGDVISNRSMENLQKEMDKCVLLCPNCHRWLHYQEILEFQNFGKNNNKK